MLIVQQRSFHIFIQALTLTQNEASRSIKNKKQTQHSVQILFRYTQHQYIIIATQHIALFDTIAMSAMDGTGFPYQIINQDVYSSHTSDETATESRGDTPGGSGEESGYEADISNNAVTTQLENSHLQVTPLRTWANTLASFLSASSAQVTTRGVVINDFEVQQIHSAILKLVSFDCIPLPRNILTV
jgi:hypothetical protein